MNRKIMCTGSTNMGSCWCGDSHAELWAEDGVLMCECTGYEKWQQFKGKAKDCRVGYGLGSAVRKVAKLWEAGAPPAERIRGGQGADVIPTKPERAGK